MARLESEEVASSLDIAGLIGELGNPAEGMDVRWLEGTAPDVLTSADDTVTSQNTTITAIVTFSGRYSGAGISGSAIKWITSGTVTIEFSGTAKDDGSNKTVALTSYSAKADGLKLVQSNGTRSNTYNVTATGITGSVDIDMTYPISQGATEIADPSVTVGETITVNSGMTITVDGESTTMIMPWSGNSDTSWHNSAETEFIITTPEQLAGLSKLVSDGNSFTGKTIKLANDLNMNNLLWTPIGARTRNSTTLASSTLFKGSFDGQDHVIRNLYVYQEEGVDEDSVSGLFGVIAGASISNLRLEDSTITDSSDTAGGIVGAIIAETDETTLITNCHSNATVHGKGAAAGILGRAYGSGTITITNCTNSGSISSDDKAGGITAINNSTANTTISGCSNSGAISNADSGAGGILGYANNNIKIENAENSGPVTAGRYGGGIVGYTSNTNDEPSYVMTIVSNTAAIHAENTAGGIIGLGQKFTITNATNSGAITSDQFAGGIAGSMTGMTITDSKNTAAVHGEYYAGGIAGDLQGNNSVSTTSGGTAAITTGEPTIGTLQASNGTTYSDYRGYAGRLFGSLANSPNRSTASKLTVDDTNGDSYADLGTIGIIGHASGWGGLIVEGGTFHGIPAIGGGPGQIEFSADAEWNGYEMTEGETVYRLTRDSESGQTKVAPQAWYAQ